MPEDPQGRRDTPPPFPPGVPEQGCDLIMKGGITSGVVYPGTVRVLATAFRFRRIGGTSAGAIAATLTAAAELRRRRERDLPTRHQGFVELERLGEELQAPLGPRDPRTRLEGLFAPNLSARVPYRLMQVALTPKAGVLRTVGRVLGVLIPAFPLPSLLGAAGLVLTCSPLVLFGLPLLLAGLLWLAAATALHARAVLTENAFGLSRGFDPAEPAAGRFTDWMERQLGRLLHSGVPDPGRPLTFGDLNPGLRPRGPDGQFTDDLGGGELPPGQAIDLRLVTTCLTFNRPYIFPMDSGAADDQRFWFRADELSRYFPAPTVRWMVDHSEVTLTVPRGPAAGTYHRLPPPASLPVLVATRLSMSFPLLFSAVPLHHGAPLPEGASDPQAEGCLLETPGAAPVPARCVLKPVLFSDGGLTSNFPLMLFDDVVPSVPTFAVNLEYLPAHHPQPGEEVILPEPYPVPLGPESGVSAPHWTPQRDETPSLTAFAMSILESARNWFDNSLIPLPGHVERIAHVRLYTGEGGLNLRMPRATIATLIGRGVMAGNLLLERFGPSLQGGAWVSSAGWETYRASRFLSVTNDLQRFLGDYRAAYGPLGTPLGLPGLATLTTAGLTEGRGVTLTDQQWQEAQGLMQGGALNAFKVFDRLRGQRALLRYRPVL